MNEALGPTSAPDHVACVECRVPFDVVYRTLRDAFSATGELHQHQIVADAGYLALVVEQHLLALVLTAPDDGHTAIRFHRHPAAQEAAPGPLSARIATRQWQQITERVQERCRAMLATAVHQIVLPSPSLLERSIGAGMEDAV